MSIIKIKNFGPIGQNSHSNDGLFTVKFSPVTVFIGHQASGKSTMTKLFSIFTWIEKKLVRGDFLYNNGIFNEIVFRNGFIAQEIYQYFNDNTKIIYIGSMYSFEYEKKAFKITETKASSLTNYVLPKIQYVSAARNLLTILYAIPQDVFIDKNGSTVDLLNNIPRMVRDLNTEYINSLSKLKDIGFKLPIKNISVFHQDRHVFVKTKNKRISMSAASSGIQSITPLLMVSAFLSKEVQKSFFEKLQAINSVLKKRIENKILITKKDKLIESFNLYYDNGEYSFENDKDTLDQLLNIIKQFLSSCFINIVEEPEQNLFPNTQADVLYELIKYKNENKFNQLVISTHSPYILTSLNNAILAKDVFKLKGTYIEELPENKTISFEDVSAYKLEDGNIFSIIDKKSRLINAEQIDDCSTKINEVFSKLMEQNNG